jgi:ribonuclease BN (tRNA processing enzyme)
MAVAFLGTGSGVPSLERNVTSIAVKLGACLPFLIATSRLIDHRTQRAEP